MSFAISFPQGSLPDGPFPGKISPLLFHGAVGRFYSISNSFLLLIDRFLVKNHRSQNISDTFPDHKVCSPVTSGLAFID